MNVSVQKGKDSFEPKMELRLAESDGEVLIVGRDSDGKEWYIASIGRKGIRLNGNIGMSTKWPLDEYGYLKILNER